MKICMVSSDSTDEARDEIDEKLLERMIAMMVWRMCLIMRCVSSCRGISATPDKFEGRERCSSLIDEAVAVRIWIRSVVVCTSVSS